MALAALPRTGMAGVVGGVIVNLQVGRGESVGELALKLLGNGAHYSASLFVDCQFLIGKSSNAYFRQ
jgi:hypothetical protein